MYVTLFFNKNKCKNLQKINHAILTHPRFMEVVTAATVDCYLQHADMDNNPESNSLDKL